MESEILIAKKKMNEIGLDFRSKNGDGLSHLCSDHNAPMVHACASMGQDINLQNFDGDTALHLAVRKGNTEVVNSLLMCGADPNVRNKLGQVPTDVVKCESIAALLKIYKPGLVQAVAKGEFSHLLKLVNRLCVNLTSKIKDNKSALDIAQENAKRDAKHARCCALLEEQKYSMSLFHAVLQDDISTVQEILTDNKCNINKRYKEKYGWPPVAYAISWRCHEILEALINTERCNLNIRIATEPLGTITEPLYFKTLNKDCPVEIWRLVRDSMDRNQDSERDVEGNTGIFRALQCEKSAEFIEELINWKNGACITERNANGQTPREVALNIDRQDVVKVIDQYICDHLDGDFLVQLPVLFYEQEYLAITDKDGADLQSLVNEKGTANDQQALINYETIMEYGPALFKAVEDGDLKGVAKYNKSHYTDRNGFTALTKAIVYQQIKAAEILLTERPGLKVMPDNCNRYPLHYAYALPSNVSEEFVQLLLARDAEGLEHKLDRDGRLPVDYRQLRETEEISQMFYKVKTWDPFGKKQPSCIEEDPNEDPADSCCPTEIAQNEETGESEERKVPCCEQDGEEQRAPEVAC